jgi:hypothetical protein
MEAQRMYLLCRAMDQTFESRVRPPRANEPRDPTWRAYDPTDHDKVLQAQEETNLSEDEDAENLEESLVAFNAEMDTLRGHLSKLTHDQLESRLHDLSRAHGLTVGEAEVELIARLLKDERWPLRHPMQAPSWAWRHRDSAPVRVRLHQLRTNSVTFAR